MAQAVLVSTRASCPGRLVGAVLVQDKVIRGTGYNGAPAGLPDCLEVGCDEDANGHCIRAIHAEANALLTTDVSHRDGATIYCTDMPCFRCANMIANTGVQRVVWARIFAKHAEKVSALFAAKKIALDHVDLPQSATGGLLPPPDVLARLGLDYQPDQLAEAPLPHR